MEKNIKLLLLICFILYQNNANSQNYKIEYYTYTKNTVDTTGIRSYLIFNNSNSVFVWKSINNSIKKNKEISDESDTKITFKKVINDTIGTRVYNDYSKKQIILREPLLENNFKVIDYKVKINWKIENEFKKIGNLKCQKAYGVFRGRNYIAWFTTTFPLPTGPWKLQGLPGLILEAYDENKEVNFIFKSLNRYSKEKEKIRIPLSKDAITIKEFVKKKDDIHRKIINQYLSKLPRGVKVKSSHKAKRKGIETKFEWEEEIKED
tara:strand:+ start:266 stop:1057 length:792 start_codon:yes stop_codon:yes gene_type:complete